MLATPLGAFDVVVGHLLHLALRVPAAGERLPGLRRRSSARCRPGAGCWPCRRWSWSRWPSPPRCSPSPTYLNNDTGFNILFRLVMIPLFLFSGTFFPISQLPVVVIELVARVTPLWHGVAAGPRRDAGAARPRTTSGTRRTSWSGSSPARPGRSTGCAAGWWSEMCLSDAARSRPHAARPGRRGGRAQRPDLPPAVGRLRHRLPRTGLLPALDRRRCRGPGRASPVGGRAIRDRTPSSSRRPCWPSRR